MACSINHQAIQERLLTEKNLTLRLRANKALEIALAIYRGS